jgi:hypothetical protein
VAPVPAAVPVNADGVPLVGVVIDRHEFGYRDNDPSVPWVIATVICCRVMTVVVLQEFVTVGFTRATVRCPVIVVPLG